MFTGNCTKKVLGSIFAVVQTINILVYIKVEKYAKESYVWKQLNLHKKFNDSTLY